MKATSHDIEVIRSLIESILLEFLDDIEDVKGTEFEDLSDMYKDDYEYGKSCLENFNNSRDVVALLTDLRSQDTSPRERYREVFDYGVIMLDA